MSTLRHNRDDPHLTFGQVAFPDFDISWAGDSGWSPGYCFGSEDGRVRFVGLHGAPDSGPYEVAPSGESINGVAFSGDMMAVSTRAEVAFLNVPRPGGGKVEHAVYRAGAFDVVALPQGGFVASLGRNGLLISGKKQSGAQRITTHNAGDNEFNVYKVTPLASVSGLGDVIACAARTHGFGIMAINEGHLHVQGMRLRAPGIDFIDTCSLGSENYPLAAAALGSDGSIHLTSDVLEDPSLQTLRFGEIRGRAYRIFCYKGHLIMLTSRGVYTLMDVGSRFLGGEPIDKWTKSRRLEFQPVDAEMSADGQLFVVMSDRVYQIRLETLIEKDEDSDGGVESGMTANGMVTTSFAVEISKEPWEALQERPWNESGELILSAS